MQTAAPRDGASWIGTNENGRTRDARFADYTSNSLRQTAKALLANAANRSRAFKAATVTAQMSRGGAALAAATAADYWLNGSAGSNRPPLAQAPSAANVSARDAATDLMVFTPEPPKTPPILDNPSQEDLTLGQSGNSPKLAASNRLIPPILAASLQKFENGLLRLDLSTALRNGESYMRDMRSLQGAFTVSQKLAPTPTELEEISPSAANVSPNQTARLSIPVPGTESQDLPKPQALEPTTEANTIQETQPAVKLSKFQLNVEEVDKQITALEALQERVYSLHINLLRHQRLLADEQSDNLFKQSSRGLQNLQSLQEQQFGHIARMTGAFVEQVSNITSLPSAQPAVGQPKGELLKGKTNLKEPVLVVPLSDGRSHTL
ncbi:hypothetical protein DFJ73DRAFT_155317 [Zopfochytrium polystomum]|nr:hypothetical protein DFJ73DRAFT_155317 [Zopfochytrium polystomum]